MKNLKMNLYKNKNSGVQSYKIEPNGIIIQFRDGHTYLYTNQSAGVQKIEHMKKLAQIGFGLNTFISTEIRSAYAEKLN